MSVAKSKAVVTQNPSPKQVQMYFEWILSQDANLSPVTDLTGERSARNQGIADIWFLAGSSGGYYHIQRECMVPVNQPIHMHPATTDATFAEYSDIAKTDSDLQKIARAIAALHRNVSVEITDSTGTQAYGVSDAKNPKNDELKLVETDLFQVNLPENNIHKSYYGVKGGYTRVVGIAWGIIATLEEGDYTVKMHAEHPSQDNFNVGLSQTIDVKPFELDIEYKLHARGKTKLPLPYSQYSG